MKDYYKILGVTKSSTVEDVRKSYRKLAMQYHPDRNPDDAHAEEKFKDIAEAYGVLTDPVKKREYDAYRSQGGSTSSGAHGQAGFSYSQEDILRDLFNDPKFQQMFTGLLKEFQRSGFRSNPNFLRNCFLGGKGGLFIGGLFFIGSIAGPSLIKATTRLLSGKPSVLNSIGRSVVSLLGREKADVERKAANENSSDVFYHVSLSDEEMQSGKWLQVALPENSNREVIRVKIPALSKPGLKLRIPKKGRKGFGARGDLFLILE